MTAVTKFKVSNHELPDVPNGQDTPWVFKLALKSADAASGDTIEIVDWPVDYMLVDAVVWPTGTLGASCTLKLQQGSTDLTAATTAAASTLVRATVLMTPENSSERTLKLLVGGADIGADADVYVITRQMYLPVYSS